MSTHLMSPILYFCNDFPSLTPPVSLSASHSPLPMPALLIYASIVSQTYDVFVQYVYISVDSSTFPTSMGLYELPSIPRRSPIVT